MEKIITQDHGENKEIEAKIKQFLSGFGVGVALKAANAYKQGGFSVLQVFRYLFELVFANRSMYMDMLTGKAAAEFGKDTVYRFTQSVNINWVKFTTMLAQRVAAFIEPLTGSDRINVFIIDDSVVGRDRSKKVELLAKVYDHAKKVYRLGFRMLTLGWSDGNTFLPVNSVLLSSENKKTRIKEANMVDKRTCGYKRRQMAVTKAPAVMLELLKEAKKAGLKAAYVLFDSWFTSPSSIHAVKSLGYHVIAMVKKTPKMFFRYQGEDMPLTEIYKRNKKRRGLSKYLLSVLVEVVKDGKKIPAKVVYVRNKNKKSDYLCIISTDINIDEDEIIRIYGKRWDIEVFFKVCKSYLRLGKDCQSLSYDAMTAHTAIVFARYLLLAVEERQSKDERSLCELLYIFSDELADITWIQAFRLMMDIFTNILSDRIGLTDNALNELLDIFLSAIPSTIKQKLRLA